MRRLVVATTVLSGTALAHGAKAQVTIEEVLVTAQKRDALAQDVPIALSVLPQSMLENLGITRVEDLRDVVPGLEVVSNNPSDNIIAMRGVVALGGNIAPVGYYLDETPVSTFASSAPDVALWDLQRVEVLRGPQGTLFGDGSMAGTIRAIANKPNTEGFAGRIAGSWSEYDGGGENVDLKGMLNVPLGDTFAVRALGSYLDDGGYIEVPELNQSGANAYEVTTLKLAGRWVPSDSLTVDASWTNYDLEQGRSNDQTSPGVYDPLGTFLPGFALPLTMKDRRDLEYDLYNLTLNWDLGAFTLVSATSHFDQDGNSFADLNTVVPGFFFGAPVAPLLVDTSAAQISEIAAVQSTTQEFRLVSNGDQRLDWTVGVFYRDEERIDRTGFDLRVNADGAIFGVPGVVVPIADEYAPYTYEDAWEALAVFGEVDYELTDTLTINIGLRYYEDDRKTDYTILPSPVFGLVEEQGRVTGDDDAWSPKFALSWGASEDVTVFASVSKGFRSGDINLNHRLRPEEISPGYSAETLWTYEAGLKSLLAPNLQANFYVYYNDWQDLQLGVVTPDGLLAFTENTGAADATGTELEVAWQPMSGFTVMGSVSWVDAQIKETVLAGDSALEIATAGNKLPIVPEWSGSLSADYSRSFGSGLMLRVGGSYSYRDRTFSDAANAANQENDSYSVLNMRLGLEAEAWGLFLFGRNITGSEDTTFRRQPVQLLPEVVFSTYIPPRRVGVEFSYRF
jgi:outer membrane receptor protein involved in Fe transport